MFSVACLSVLSFTVGDRLLFLCGGSHGGRHDHYCYLPEMRHPDQRNNCLVHQARQILPWLRLAVHDREVQAVDCSSREAALKLS